MENDYDTGLGIQFGIQNGAQFDLFKVSIHYHRTPADSCDFIAGVVLAIVGIQVCFGIWKVWE